MGDTEGNETTVRNEAWDLRRAAGVFLGHASPRVIVVALGATAVARLVVARWSWWDLLAPGAILAAQPFTEWLIHVFLLHFKPRRVAGMKVDPLVARKHRAHHLDPKDQLLVFIPLPALAGLILGSALIWLVTSSAPIALSAMTAIYLILLVYEWTHFLIHSTYRPRHALYRYVWRAHRNHHYRNERYWFGVTVHLADHLLGTFPNRADVEVSPTARTLGVGQAA
ncbi:MAG TPA: sterol desaturase family protein [Acidimicrobiales bacterium]|nr:sterol desaturase family protein [Acidimicrobiales bacterium]